MIVWPEGTAQPDRIEAMLAELLRRITPDEAVPAMTQRLIAGLPTVTIHTSGVVHADFWSRPKPEGDLN